jgi:hypothetical protein
LVAGRTAEAKLLIGIFGINNKLEGSRFVGRGRFAGVNKVYSWIAVVAERNRIELEGDGEAVGRLDCRKGGADSYCVPCV